MLAHTSIAVAQCPEQEFLFQPARAFERGNAYSRASGVGQPPAPGQQRIAPGSCRAYREPGGGVALPAVGVGKHRHQVIGAGFAQLRRFGPLEAQRDDAVDAPAPAAVLPVRNV